MDALNGDPGLHSARYSPKPGATDADRRLYLLEKLAGISQPWPAHFHCTVVITTPDGLQYHHIGNCFGEIIPEERGSNGFGYDPIFYLSETGKTMAEMADDHKNRISHRALAIHAARTTLEKIFKDNGRLP